jgi:hypothetical protein
LTTQGLVKFINPSKFKNLVKPIPLFVETAQEDNSKKAQQDNSTTAQQHNSTGAQHQQSST